MFIVELKNIKRGKHVIITQATMQVDKGINLLQGPNGSGKTTLLRAIAGDEKITYKGRILLNGKNLAKLPVEKRAKEGIIYAFQEVPEVEITPALILEYHGIKKRGGLWEKPFSEMSGGEKRLMDLLLTLELKPKVLLVDEIDAHLDEKNKALIANKLSEFSKEGIVLLVTHTKEFAYKLPIKKRFEIREKKVVEI